MCVIILKEKRFQKAYKNMNKATKKLEFKSFKVGSSRWISRLKAQDFGALLVYDLSHSTCSDLNETLRN